MSNIDRRVPVGTAVVLHRDGHVLLGKRKNAHGAGTWGFPGGKPDPGEAPKPAAFRELVEETGIDLRSRVSLKVMPIWTYDRVEGEDAFHYVTLYFAAQCPPGAHAVVMEPHKCEEWRWASIDRPQDALGWEAVYFPGVEDVLNLIRIERGAVA